jgi:hypothetical protein
MIRALGRGVLRRERQCLKKIAMRYSPPRRSMPSFLRRRSLHSAAECDHPRRCISRFPRTRGAERLRSREGPVRRGDPATFEWPALLRKLNRIDPSYKQ